jgi:hypothetical protein
MRAVIRHRSPALRALESAKTAERFITMIERR